MQDVISLQCTFSTAVHMSKGEKGITQKAQLLIRQISERSLKHPRPLTVVDRIRVLLAHQTSRTNIFWKGRPSSSTGTINTPLTQSLIWTALFSADSQCILLCSLWRGSEEGEKQHVAVTSPKPPVSRAASLPGLSHSSHGVLKELMESIAECLLSSAWNQTSDLYLRWQV